MSEDRELDIRLAKLRGYYVKKEEGWFNLYDSSGFRNCSKKEQTCWDRVPRYTESLDPHARDIWPEIERRELWREYLEALYLGSDRPMQFDEPVVDVCRYVLLCTALEHTQAAIAVLGEEDD